MMEEAVGVAETLIPGPVVVLRGRLPEILRTPRRRAVLRRWAAPMVFGWTKRVFHSVQQWELGRGYGVR